MEELKLRTVVEGAEKAVSELDKVHKAKTRVAGGNDGKALAVSLANREEASVVEMFRRGREATFRQAAIDTASSVVKARKGEQLAIEAFTAALNESRYVLNGWTGRLLDAGIEGLGGTEAVGRMGGSGIAKLLANPLTKVGGAATAMAAAVAAIVEFGFTGPVNEKASRRAAQTHVENMQETVNRLETRLKEADRPWVSGQASNYTKRPLSPDERKQIEDEIKDIKARIRKTESSKNASEMRDRATSIARPFMPKEFLDEDETEQRNAAAGVVRAAAEAMRAAGGASRLKEADRLERMAQGIIDEGPLGKKDGGLAPGRDHGFELAAAGEADRLVEGLSLSQIQRPNPDPLNIRIDADGPIADQIARQVVPIVHEHIKRALGY